SRIARVSRHGKVLTGGAVWGRRAETWTSRCLRDDPAPAPRTPAHTWRTLGRPLDSRPSRPRPQPARAVDETAVVSRQSRAGAQRSGVEGDAVEAGEEAAEGGALGLVEVEEDLGVDLGEGGVDLGEGGAAVVGQLEDAPAAVLAVALAGDQVAVLEVVQ